ncbi:hypothetical protein J6590_026044 [Homalodisca vitripennis]|nr:hypothetical protein J6590_026044 [Homalodisca vitripennis]
MKIVLLFVLCFGSSLTFYERLGTELLQADRFICMAFRHPAEVEVGEIFNRIEDFIMYLRRLRELRIDLQKKRAIRITDALFDQGRPKFLQIDYEQLIPRLKNEFGWTDDEAEQLDELVAETERVCGELYRKYKYSIYVKFSTRKPLPF